MARLIDADALDDVVGKLNKNGIRITRGEYKLINAVIFQFPTIEERKKGEWIRENIVLTSNPPQYQWHCSECGRMVHWFTTEVLTDYCPNCGADMRGEEDERNHLRYRHE